MDRPRDPELAARLFGSSPERRLALMRCAWPAAVGPELARRTEVVSLDGVLRRVRVPDSTWRRGLLRMRGDILARLRSIAGGAAPRSLGFVEGAVDAADAAPPASGARGKAAGRSRRRRRGDRRRGAARRVSRRGRALPRPILVRGDAGAAATTGSGSSAGSPASGSGTGMSTRPGSAAGARPSSAEPSTRG